MNVHARSWTIRQHYNRLVMDRMTPLNAFRSLVLAAQLAWLAVIWLLLISGLA